MDTSFDNISFVLRPRYGKIQKRADHKTVKSGKITITLSSGKICGKRSDQAHVIVDKY